MNILFFSGSLRTASLNKKLARVASAILEKTTDHTANTLDLKPLAIPVYDGDIETTGMPSGITALGAAITKADALVIASPEYNGSIASPLKNAIDWLSRLKPMPLAQKPVLLLGASPGQLGAVRALNHTRQPFEALGSFVYPQTFGLPLADKAFAENGDLANEAMQKRLTDLLSAFLNFAIKLSA